jgi:adenylate cyclase
VAPTGEEERVSEASRPEHAQDQRSEPARTSPLAPPQTLHRFALPPLDVPPRVSRSFAFVDLCGFTEFVETYGDLEGLVELNTLRRILREATLLHRARVDKWLGDGALLVALDTETMLEAVLAAGREHHGRGRLLLRGGITEGPAILCDDDYVGAVVNLAARLCDSAAPGTILVQSSEDPPSADPAEWGERETARRMIGRATAVSLLPEAPAPATLPIAAADGPAGSNAAEAD